MFLLLTFGIFCDSVSALLIQKRNNKNGHEILEPPRTKQQTNVVKARRRVGAVVDGFITS